MRTLRKATARAWPPTSHPYTNMELVRQVYLGLIGLEEEDEDEEKVLLPAAVIAT